jgi:asparaginyl-tRNA synthetase
VTAGRLAEDLPPVNNKLDSTRSSFFLTLRDGTAFAQAIMTGDAIRTIDALDLTVETTVEVKGTVEKVKEKCLA